MSEIELNVPSTTRAYGAGTSVLSLNRKTGEAGNRSCDPWIVSPACYPLLAADQWWPRTSGGRLRFIRAITYSLRHRISNFVEGNKRNLHKKD